MASRKIGEEREKQCPLTPENVSALRRNAAGKRRRLKAKLNLVTAQETLRNASWVEKKARAQKHFIVPTFTTSANALSANGLKI
jgi:hypothetical protein